jgi:hypothetical protein
MPEQPNVKPATQPEPQSLAARVHAGWDEWHVSGDLVLTREPQNVTPTQAKTIREEAERQGVAVIIEEI